MPLYPPPEHVTALVLQLLQVPRAAQSSLPHGVGGVRGLLPRGLSQGRALRQRWQQSYWWHGREARGQGLRGLAPDTA